MRAILLAPLAVAACAQFPELDAVSDPVARLQPYPVLVPIPVFTRAAPPPRLTPPVIQTLEARAAALTRQAAATPDASALARRAAALRQRAAGLRAETVLTDEDRARLTP